MSREIKFRVWDHKHKTMGRVIGWSRYELLEEIGNVAYYVNDKTSLQSTDSERIEIMQYTGIKDKNGVEIYEGDITSMGIIGFRKGTFTLESISTFDLKYKRSRNYNALHNVGSGRLRVIGNIHDNFELLEE